MAERKVGDLLDKLGLTVDIEDDDMVTNVVVIAKNVMGDGQVSVIIGKSEGTTWLDQLGLVEAARDIMRQGGYEQTGEQ